MKSKKLTTLLTNHNIFYFGREFLKVFLNILIWQETNDIRMVALFNIAKLVAHIFPFFMFGDIVKRGNNVIIKRIGLFGYAGAVIMLAIWPQFFLTHAYIYGFISGFFNGMYWINYHTVRFDFTNKENRAEYRGWESSLKIMAGLAIPIIGGAMLTFLPGNTGTISLFISAIILCIATTFFANYNSSKPDHNNLAVDFKDTFKVVLKDKSILKSLVSNAFGGFVRNGAFLRMLIPLYILASVNNEFELGNILAGISLLSALAYIIIGKRIKFSFYKTSISIGILLQILSIILLLVSPNFVTFIIYSIIQTVSAPFSEVPAKVMSTNIIHKVPDYKNHRIEYIAIREVFNIGLGWIPSYILLLFFSDINSPGMIASILSIMIVFIFIEMFLLTSIPKEDYGV